ncbi:hypothetical protein P8452_27819 [Trifolium repens]|nr:hypothetical protein P8452_27819 [Trifolium repens]
MFPPSLSITSLRNHRPVSPPAVAVTSSREVKEQPPSVKPSFFVIYCKPSSKEMFKYLSVQGKQRRLSTSKMIADIWEIAVCKESDFINEM